MKIFNAISTPPPIFEIMQKKPTGKQLIHTLPNDVVEKNPKYNHVQSKIDSGATIDKFYAKHGVNGAAKLNQHNIHNVTSGFKRIRLTTLAKWLETAMIVLSEPDYVETNESIYDLAGVQPPAEKAISEVTSTLSMAGTEAQVCMEEPGVPPMYMFGPDIAEPEEIQQQTKQINYKIDPVVQGQGQNVDLMSRNQMQQNYEETVNQTRQFAQQNRQSNFQLSYNDAPNTLKYVQQLTTRERQQKLVQRIHLKPDLQLEIYKGQNVGRSVAFPCRTKQFVVVDMRYDPEEFKQRHFWGSVHLPVSMLHRAGGRMPGPLHYFAKFEESIFVVVGLSGIELERALNELVDYGVNKKNVVPLMQDIDQCEQEYPNLFVRQ